jgi:hypothetical protein
VREFVHACRRVTPCIERFRTVLNNYFRPARTTRSTVPDAPVRTFGSDRAPQARVRRAPQFPRSVDKSTGPPVAAGPSDKTARVHICGGPVKSFSGSGA